MKKKKINCRNCNWRVFGIIIISFAVCIALGLLINLAFNQEPHFKITKEECWNETKVIGQKLISEKITECNKTITFFYTNIGELKSCWSEDFEFDCNYKECIFYSSETPLGNAYRVIVREEPYFDIIQNYEPMKEIREICEQTEVDEIEYVFETVCFGCLENPQECKSNCFGNGCSFKIWEEKEFEECVEKILKCQEKCQKDMCNFDCKNFYSTTNKQDLTIEWLDENCECVGVYDKDKKEDVLCGKNEKYLCGAFTNRPNYFECSKYKCESYIVEVK